MSMSDIESQIREAFAQANVEIVNVTGIDGSGPVHVDHRDIPDLQALLTAIEGLEEKVGREIVYRIM